MSLECCAAESSFQAVDVIELSYGMVDSCYWTGKLRSRVVELLSYVDDVSSCWIVIVKNKNVDDSSRNKDNMVLITCSHLWQ